MSTSTSCRLCVRRAADLERARRRPHRRLQRGPVVEVPPGERAAGAQPVDGALEHHLAAGGARAGTEVDDVVGDRDRLRLVLDDEHGVALVAQLQQQVVHPLDVVRVQPDRRLVEDVGDVGERRPEVADHLGALRLAARQRARRAVEREVAEPDLDERVERVAAAPSSSGATDGSSRPRTHSARSLICIAQASAMLIPSIFDDRAASLSRVPPQSGQAVNVDRPLDEGADVRLHRVDVLRQHRLLDLRDQALVGQVDALDLDLGRLLVEEVVELLLGELLDRLVGVEEARSR